MYKVPKRLFFRGIHLFTGCWVFGLFSEYCPVMPETGKVKTDFKNIGIRRKQFKLIILNTKKMGIKCIFLLREYRKWCILSGKVFNVWKWKMIKFFYFPSFLILVIKANSALNVQNYKMYYVLDLYTITKTIPRHFWSASLIWLV